MCKISLMMFISAFVLTTVVVLVDGAANGINCRRYAFAPACRGMQIKRANHDEPMTSADALAAKYGHEIIDFLLQIQNSVEATRLMTQRLLNRECLKQENFLGFDGISESREAKLKV